MEDCLKCQKQKTKQLSNVTTKTLYQTLEWQIC